MNTEIKMNKSDAKILLLYLYKVLEKVCEKSGVKCFAYQGTLLGAVKYGGMIPWDDDMDFVIFRKDYDLFLKTCKEVLEEPVVIQCRETDPYCCTEYFKLCFRDDLYGYSDVALDVFIFDDTNPKRKVLRYFQEKSLLWLYYIKRYNVAKMGKGREYNPKNPVKRIILKITSFIKLEKIDKWHRRIMTIDKTDGEHCVNWGSHYHRDLETYKKSDWSNDTIELKFENINITAPKKYDQLLSQLYGKDYMAPYPESKQVDHGVRKLNNYNINIEKIKKDINW